MGMNADFWYAGKEMICCITTPIERVDAMREGCVILTIKCHEEAMSCLADFKVLPILDDATDEIVCAHLVERDSSFFQRVTRKISTGTMRFIRKYIFRNIY